MLNVDPERARISAHQEIIDRLVPSQRFVRRDWLVRAVAGAFDDTGCRHVIVAGQPGSGKSVFLAGLAVEWNCPRHFARLDSTAGVTGSSTRAFLVSIGAQLYQKYGETIFRDTSGSTRVSVALAGGNAEIVGRLVDELHTFPFLPPPTPQVEVTVGAAFGHSRVVGERIRRLVDATILLDEATLLHAAVLDPVRRLFERDPSEQVVVLIDAIDEVMSQPNHGLVGLIPTAADADVPPNLRFVMTSRHGDHFARFAAAAVIDLDDAMAGYAEASRRDALAYISERTANGPLADVLESWTDARRREFEARVAAAGKANFLYLYHFFNETERLARDGSAPIDQLPVPRDLDAIYRYFAVEKIRARIADAITVTADLTAADVEAIAGVDGVGEVEQSGGGVRLVTADLNRSLSPLLALLAARNIAYRDLRVEQGAMAGLWESKYVPVIGVLAVAFEALSAAQLAQLAGVEREYADSVIRHLREFLNGYPDAAEDRYEIYHSSFADYLTDAARSREYTLDASRYHRAIATFYCRTPAGAAAAADEDVDWSRWDHYGWMHTVRHLYAARATADTRERLYSLIGRSFLRAKEDRYGSHEPAAADLLLLIDAADERDADLGHAFRGRLIFASLASPAALLSPGVIGTLVRVGWQDRARYFVNAMSDPRQRVRALRMMGVALAEIGDSDRAADVLSGVLAHVAQWSEGGGDIYLFAGIAPSLVKVGRQDAVLDVLDRLADPELRLNLLSRLAIGLAETHQLDAARAIADTAERELAAAQDPEWTADCKARLAKAFAVCGELPRAAALAAGIAADAVRADALATIAALMAAQNHMDDAATTAAAIAGDDAAPPVARTVAAAVLAVTGRLDPEAVLEALRERAQALDDVQDRVEAWRRGIETLAHDATRALRARFVDDCAGAAGEVDDPRLQLRALLAIAHAAREMPDAGELATRAIALADALDNPEQKSIHLNECAYLLTEFGDVAGARTLVDRAIRAVTAVLPRNFDHGRLDLVDALCTALARRGSIEQACGLADWAVNRFPAVRWTLGPGDADRAEDLPLLPPDERFPRFLPAAASRALLMLRMARACTDPDQRDELAAEAWDTASTVEAAELSGTMRVLAPVLGTMAHDNRTVAALNEALRGLMLFSGTRPEWLLRRTLSAVTQRSAAAAAAIAEHLVDPAARAHAHLFCAHDRLHAGDAEGARAHARRLVRDAEQFRSRQPPLPPVTPPATDDIVDVVLQCGEVELAGDVATAPPEIGDKASALARVAAALAEQDPERAAAWANGLSFWADQAWAYYGLAAGLSRRANAIEQAVVTVSAVRELNASCLAWVTTAECLLARGEHARALRLADTAAADAENAQWKGRETLVRAAMLHARGGSTERAMEIARRLLASSPPDAPALDALACLVAAGAGREALAMLDGVSAHMPIGTRVMELCATVARTIDPATALGVAAAADSSDVAGWATAGAVDGSLGRVPSLQLSQQAAAIADPTVHAMALLAIARDARDRDDDAESRTVVAAGIGAAARRIRLPEHRTRIANQLAAFQAEAGDVEGAANAWRIGFGEAHLAGRRFVLESAATGVRVGAIAGAALKHVADVLTTVEPWWGDAQAAGGPEWARLTVGQNRIW
jgi:tetratricopeptide (TPR) repeat protein